MKRNRLSFILLLLTFSTVLFASEKEIYFDEEDTNQLKELASTEGLLFATSHFASYHIIRAVDENGMTLILEDESVWNIDPYTQRVVSSWLPFDQILIGVNTSQDETGDYPYRFFNSTLIQSVPCSLAKEPNSDNRFARKIIKISSYFSMQKREILLDDGSRWVMSMFDNSYKEWEVNDLVIIASNFQFLFLANPNILINATKKDFARGSCADIKIP